MGSAPARPGHLPGAAAFARRHYSTATPGWHNHDRVRAVEVVPVNYDDEIQWSTAWSAGTLVTVAPVDPARVEPGDIVLARVAGTTYLHLVSAIDTPASRAQIGNKSRQGQRVDQSSPGLRHPHRC
nr:hypothetical protein GCM10020063_092350 [Dactylosporangium thailandense]